MFQLSFVHLPTNWGCMISIPNLVKTSQTLYAHMEFWLHNPVSHFQEGKRIKNPLLVHEAVVKLFKNSLIH
jgi:hypothetical protein